MTRHSRLEYSTAATATLFSAGRQQDIEAIRTGNQNQCAAATTREDQMDTHAEDDYAGGRAPVGEFVPVRRGRGGFDPEADAIAREARYAFRQRTLLGLAFVAILSGALALIISPMVWWLFCADRVRASAGTWRTCVGRFGSSKRFAAVVPNASTDRGLGVESHTDEELRLIPARLRRPRSGCPRGRRRRSGVRSPGSLRRRDQAHRDCVARPVSDLLGRSRRAESSCRVIPTGVFVPVRVAEHR